MGRTLAVCFLIAFVLTLALSGSAFANRDIALGYANAVIKDQANMWFCPSTLIHYPDMMRGEIDTDDGFYQGGAHFGVGDQVFAVYFDKIERDYLFLPSLNAGDTLYMKQRIDLFGARNFGDVVPTCVENSIFRFVIPAKAGIQNEVRNCLPFHKINS